MKLIKYFNDLYSEDINKISKTKTQFLINLIVIRPLSYVFACILLMIMFAWVFSGFGIMMILMLLAEHHYTLAIIIALIDLIILFLYIKQKFKDYEKENPTI